LLGEFVSHLVAKTMLISLLAVFLALADAVADTQASRWLPGLVPSRLPAEAPSPTRRALLRAAPALLPFLARSPARAIVGGQPVAEDEMAARGVVGVVVDQADPGRSGFCTATLIDDGLVLTARHCVNNPIGELTDVVFAKDLFAKDAVKRPIVEIRTSDGEYEGRAPAKDLAMIRFSGGTPEGFRPVTLITSLRSQYSVVDGTSPASGYGFGMQSDGGSSDGGYLKKFAESIVAPVEPEMPVVTAEPNKPGSEGLCFGDSGGPVFLPTCLESKRKLMLRDAVGEAGATGLAQIGVLSFGSIGDCTGSTAEYVNLADYGKWICETARAMGGRIKELQQA